MSKIRVVCDECGFECIVEAIFPDDKDISFCSGCGDENILTDEVIEDEDD